MAHTQVGGNVHATPKAESEQQSMISLVEGMAREIRRLDEDNAQLRAAIAIYREVLSRYTGQPAGNADGPAGRASAGARLLR
jgi:hypothetical protein